MKKNFCFCTLLFSFLFICGNAFAQSDSLLNLISDLSEDESYLAELLVELEENPLNINEADKNDLMTLPLITAALADSIITARQKKGPYTNKRQLRTITGLRIYDLIRNYISASQKHNYSVRLIQRTLYKIEPIPEIENGTYSGDALNYYSRIKYQPHPYITAGLVTQKDAGEKDYLDHYNFSLQYTNQDWNILLGDFFLQAGEGLTHNNPYGNSKSIFFSAVFRESARLARPNLTSSESSGKFGLFVQNNLSRQLTLFAFYSDARRDVQLTDKKISGFSYDGFHRSINEQATKNRLHEKSSAAGVRMTFFESLRLQTFFNHYAFSKKIDQSVTLIGENQKRRQYFNFSGSRLTQLSAACSWLYNDFKLSGEISASDKGRPGWSQSVYYAKEGLHFGLRTWYLNADFQSVDGRVFDSNDPFPQGVKGYFTGMALKLDEHNTFSAFKKYEQSLWRSYFNPMPTVKHEWLAQWDLDLKQTELSCRFRSRKWDDFLADESGSRRIENDQQSIRLQLTYSPARKLRSRTRWENNSLLNTNQKGTLIFQELNYTFNKEISLSSRFTFFNTSSFDARVYEYERDLPGTFSNIALFGNGNKIYMLLKWKIIHSLTLWVKWRYISKEAILATGRVNKRLNRDIRMQVQTLF